MAGIETTSIEGSRWTRSGYYGGHGVYNGYTVLFVTNTSHIHENHPPQVIYKGDNGRLWSLPLDQWPGNLIQEVA